MDETALVVEAFTELAPRYEQVMERELQELWGLSYRNLVQRVTQMVSRDERGLVLDVATGTAQIPLALAGEAPACAVVGLDITPAMLRGGLANIGARGLGRQVRLVCASAMEMPLAQCSFDVVTCALGMHHMDVPGVLREMRRVLRDGGQVVIACVRAPTLWRTSLATAMIRLATLVYALSHRNARAHAEADAVPNLRTLNEWQAVLLKSRFSAVEVVAEFRPRRFWYPGAMILRALKADGFATSYSPSE
jgi:ubiquinone/menaquinone biosynthesis C-methylase UbiE